MKPNPSVLKILDFAVTEMEFRLVMPPPQYKGNFVDHFKLYELDLDFSMFNDKVLRVEMSIAINSTEKPLPGYRIKAKVATLFQFEETTRITAEEKKTIESFSTVYMALNNLRGIVSSFTAAAPFGRYTIPSIDLHDLINKKREEDKKIEMKEAAKEKTLVKSEPGTRLRMTSEKIVKTKAMNKSD